jgi:hypothetical protein
MQKQQYMDKILAVKKTRGCPKSDMGQPFILLKNFNTIGG